MSKDNAGCRIRRKSQELACSELWSYASPQRSTRPIALPIQRLQRTTSQRGDSHNPHLPSLKSTRSRLDRGKWQRLESELALNPELVGAQAAINVLQPYEVCVGIDIPEIFGPFKSEAVRDLSREVDEKAVELNQKEWRELMEELSRPLDDSRSGLELGVAHGTSSPATSDRSVAREIADADHSFSLLPGLDLALSDVHGPSPSTPKSQSLFISHALARTDSPCGTRSCTLTPLAPSPLHEPDSSSDSLASEYEFGRMPTPPLSFSTDSSPKSIATSPSPPLSDFVFPSLSGRSLPPKIHLEKDEQGFFTAFEDYPSDSMAKPNPTPNLLPPFLIEESPKRKPNQSRTRTIVDRLKLDSQRRAEHVSDTTNQLPVNVPVDEIPKSRPRAAEEGDGRIGFGEPYQPDISRAERKRELFLALNKHQRSDSRSSVKVQKEQKSNPGLKKDVPAVSNNSPSSHSPNDGWIDLKQPSQPRQHNRSRSQNKRHISQHSAPSNVYPPPHTAPATYTAFRPVTANVGRALQPAYYYPPNQPLPSVMPVPAPGVPQIGYQYTAYPHPQTVLVPPAPYAAPYPMVTYSVHPQQHLRANTAAFAPPSTGGKGIPGYVPAVMNRPAPVVGAMHPSVW
ncbi:hypothetical protein AAF712_000377 [Marasmius tenuissimus]|uniref:Uncharacterized protein n=1 Tax=Marasmius tenuissimus TaxID=585030 RepID=A0ABR3AGR8_9AGAR